MQGYQNQSEGLFSSFLKEIKFSEGSNPIKTKPIFETASLQITPILDNELSELKRSRGISDDGETSSWMREENHPRYDNEKLVSKSIDPQDANSPSHLYQEGNELDKTLNIADTNLFTNADFENGDFESEKKSNFQEKQGGLWGNLQRHKQDNLNEGDVSIHTLSDSFASPGTLQESSYHPKHSPILPEIVNANTETMARRKGLTADFSFLEKTDITSNPRGKSLAPLSNREVAETAKRLVDTFNEFGIKTKIESVISGPVIIQYQLSLEPGVRLQRVMALSDNLALSLAAHSLRIVAPIPGKSLIGVEIPLKKRRVVRLSEVVEKADRRVGISNKDSKNLAIKKLPIALGANITGEPCVVDLAKTPHLLIAGATGSGKSVCVNGIIVSLLMKLSPNDLRFIMIDPKMVELNVYNGIPHLLHPVITEPKIATKALEWALKEMTLRYQLLEGSGMRNIDAYNADCWKKDHGKMTLPHIIIVIDELADLMMATRKQVEEALCRLAAMSRAVGIHLILATQRPSVDVITGLIKSNFPSRIAFKVSSRIDSRTIIDSMGAEKLLGKGDMLFQNPNEGGLSRIQSAFLSDEEVNETISELRNKSTYERDKMEMMDLEEEENDEKEGEESVDEMFDRSIEIARGRGNISASMLQRKLKIGYNRAARIVEAMEERGIVSSADGSKPREVLG